MNTANWSFSTLRMSLFSAIFLFNSSHSFSQTPAQPSIRPLSDTNFCVGGNVRLVTNKVEGIRYAWLENGSFVSGGGVNDTAYRANHAGVYSVKAYDLISNDSIVSAGINVKTVSQLHPSITPNGPVSLCNGGTVLLTSSEAPRYQWYRDWVLIPGADSQSYLVTQSGYYFIVVGNACGNETDSLRVIFSSAPTSLSRPVIKASGDTAVCEGTGVWLSTFKVEGLRYAWQKDGVKVSAGGINDTSFLANATGIYSVVAYNTCNNDSIVSIGKHINTLSLIMPSISANGPASLCNGDSIVLYSSSSSGNQWYFNRSPAGSGSTYTARRTGLYKLAVTNACGIAYDSIYINVAFGLVKPQKPSLHAMGDTTFCLGGSVLLKTDYSYNSSVTYKWFRNGVLISGATDSSFNASTAGLYSVTAYSTCSGDSASSYGITVLVNPTADHAQIVADGALSFCSGDSVVLTSSNGSGYQWYINATKILHATGTIFVAWNSGLYKVNVTNSCGVTSDSIYVNVAAGPVTPATPYVYAQGDSTICYGGSVVLRTSSSAWNTALSYQWFHDGLLIPEATDSIYTASNDGLYSVTAYSTCSGDSASSRRINVLVNPVTDVARITIGGPASFCNGDSVVLSSSSHVNNKWYLNKSPLGSGNTYTARWPGLYKLSVTTACGITYDSIYVTVGLGPVKPAMPHIYATGDTTFCSGGSVLLRTPSSQWNTELYFKWLKNGVMIPGAIDSSYRAWTEGIYAVKAYSTCSGDSTGSAAIRVTVNPLADPASITAGGSLTFCNGGSVILTSSIASTYQWYRNWTPIPGAISRNYTATRSGIYYNLVSNKCGNNYNYDSIQVMVTPTPVVGEIKSSPSIINSFDHQMVNVQIEYVGSGRCPMSNCSISITSNEPQNGLGDGDIDNDWQIINSQEIRLRAERSKNGSGRIYTVSVTCTDSVGNSTTKKSQVTVPRGGFDAIVLQNPSTNEFKFLITSVLDGLISVRVHKSNGDLVETRDGIIPNNIISLGSSYLPGLYYLEFSQGSGRKTLTILKL